MRHSIFIVFLLVSFIGFAEENHVTYAWHTFTVRDRDFNVETVIREDGKTGGLIMNADIDGKKYILISLGSDITYEVMVVNTVNDYNEKEDVKCTMYQGGMSFQGEMIIINVLFLYDYKKNREVPEKVLVDVHNSSTIMEYSGLVKLDSSKY